MNRYQWAVLIIGLTGIMFMFIRMDAMSPSECVVPGTELTTYEVWCIINAEMFDPFIWLLGFLIPVLTICAFLEPKKT